MTSAPTERAASAADVWHADWLVAFGPDAEHRPLTGTDRRWVSRMTTLTVSSLAGSDIRVAEDARFVVLFSGLLTNVTELEAGATQDDAARIALRLIASRGADGFGELRGPFAVIAFDRAKEKLLIGRDQIGLGALFYARNRSEGWLLSASPDVLASQPGVSRDPDAVALSEWLCGWFPAVEDTAYREVKRVAPGHAITLQGATASVYRYWDPLPDDEDVQWLGEEELEAFEPMLNRAVSRATQGLSPAVLLSGGVDSISVALAAADLARAAGTEPPLALSLVFPDGESNEEPIQTGVARQLGLEQVMVPFEEAAGPQGLLSAAMTQSASWPQPMWNLWSPAYMALSRHAASRGRRVILTGRGGDEWLTISSYLLADQLRRGDLLGAWRLLQMRRRSNNLKGPADMARLVWMTAGRPLASAALDYVAPVTWHQRRRRKLLAERPDWIAADPAIRRAMDERIDRWIDPARPKGGFYHREGQTAIRHPAVSHDMEETQEFGRRLGARVMHPYWDVDLLVMLHRVPPDLLMRDGRSKWLVRRRLSQRLPGLGLERRGKVYAGSVFEGIMRREAPAAWHGLGGPKTLARMGVVRSADIESQAQPQSLMQGPKGTGRLWTLLNFESWLQQRV
jgi:asparagine synthase (glutamine-hydrolysing)